MKTRRYTDEQIIDAVKSSISVRGVLRKLGLKPSGGNYKSINIKLDELSLDTSHFKGQGWNVGGTQDWTGQPLEEILIQDSTYTNTNCLRKRLIKAKMFPECCNHCDRIEWMGQDIPLELEHKNGNNYDHRIENLELLCPNCHALTKTYRGKNMASAKKKIDKFHSS